MKESVTIHDVARQARVSVGTVSRVLNRKPGVGDDYVQRVQRAILETGFTSNPVARSLIPSLSARNDMLKTRTIGFVMNVGDKEDATQDDYFSRFLQGASDRVEELDLHLLYAPCSVDIERGQLPRMVRDGKVDGLLFKTGWENRNSNLAEWLPAVSRVVPTVLLMNASRDPRLSSVTCDHARGMEALVDRLVSEGHRRLGFVSVEDVGLPESLHHIQRWESFRRRVAELGLEARTEDHFRVTRDMARQSLDESMEPAVDAWLRQGEGRPTVLCCATDIYGVSWMRVATRRGIRVPQEVSVTGFMNHIEGRHSEPPLTTIDIPAEEISRLAINLLVDRMEGSSNQSPRQVSINGDLILRASSQPQKSIL